MSGWEAALGSGDVSVTFASASDICKEISVTCIAPTKAFNIAGLQTAAVYVSDEKLRYKVWRGLNTDEVAEPHAFAIDAAMLIASENAHSRYYAEDAYKAANEPKELVIVPGADNAALYEQMELIPFDKLTTFFQTNLK